MSRKDNTKEKLNDVKELTDEELQKQLNDIRSDLVDIKSSWKEQDGDAPAKTKYYIVKHLNKILLIGAFALLVVFYFQIGIPEPPEWVYIVLGSVVIGGFAAYPFAQWLVKKFIKDDRLPLVEIDPENLSDIALYNIPRSKLADIEVYDGQLNEIKTQKGRGYEAQQFGIRKEKGETKLIAMGTWIGAKTGLEVHRKEESYKSMREDLRPLVNRAIQYDVKWPNLQHRITQQVANEFIMEFEGVTNPGSESVYDDINDIVSDSEPDVTRKDFEDITGNMGNGSSSDELEISDGIEEILNGDANE